MQQFQGPPNYSIKEMFCFYLFSTVERKESDGNILELDTSEGKWNAIQVHADQAQDDVT